MLHVQEWLRKTGGDWEKLTEQLGVRVLRSSTDKRVILNYSQINSPKTHPVVSECRALTLNGDDYSLIARSFWRFFNVGENLAQTNKFDWNNFSAEDKEDGSLIKVFYYNGEWHYQTRHSFGGQLIEGCDKTWRQVIHDGLRKTDFFSKEREFRGFTFVFELCSPYNRVVQYHPRTKLVLLSIFNGYDELARSMRNAIANDLSMQRPREHNFRCLMDCQSYIAEQANNDIGFEGVVLEDCNGLRLKVKSDLYRALAKFWNNGDAVLNKNLVPLIMSGEIHKMTDYFNSPNIMRHVQYIRNEINKAYSEVDNLWFCFRDLPSKKKFAAKVKDCPYSYVLFLAYNNNTEPGMYWDSDFVLKKVSLKEINNV